MSVVVISSGRSGTNMVLEILRGNSYFKPFIAEEDQFLCRRPNEVYPDDYLTKCDTVYMTYPQLKSMLTVNPNMKVVWTIRDPRDLALSKIFRGQPKSEGGDCPTLAEDATIEGCLRTIEEMFQIYLKIIKDFPIRILLVKMEDVINDIIRETKRICDFAGIEYNDDMPKFYERMRNPNKIRRYSTLDKNEVKKWNNWETVYNGFFVKKGYDIEDLFKRLKVYIDYFGYANL